MKKSKILLIFVLGYLMLSMFVLPRIVGMPITDTDEYEKVLKLMHYPNNSVMKYCPNKIPINAKNIVLRYYPGGLQASEGFGLKFEIDADSIKNYVDKFSLKAKWIGKLSDTEAEKNGVFLIAGNNILDYKHMPEDFIIYLTESNDDWNHPKISLVAISTQRNEIIFLVRD